MQLLKEGSMINSIEGYLAELKKELAGSDRATVQDALSDAEEYLRTALEGAASDISHKSTAEALAPIIERYGQPAEVAAAYKAMESRTPAAFGRPAYQNPVLPPEPVPAPVKVKDHRPLLTRFFGVFADPKAWGAVLFTLIVFGTGIIYFTWAMTGFWTSFGLIFALLIGIPLMVLFLMSVRGIALMEGRLIEALVGVRMPRRPLFSRTDIGFWQKMKHILTERQSWTALIYMVCQLPLGIFYFSVFVSLISAGIWLIFQPIGQLAWGIPVFNADGPFYTYGWAMPFSVIGGVLLITATMHLTKAFARFHAGFAKMMLVRE
jgi:hypothetical protein